MIVGVFLAGCVPLILPAASDAIVHGIADNTELMDEKTMLEEKTDSARSYGGKLVDKLEVLDAQLKRAQERTAETRNRNERDSAALFALREELDQLQMKSTFLGEELSRNKSESPKFKPGNPVNSMTEKAPIYFIVQGSAIAPDTEKYFEYTEEYLLGSHVRTVATRIRVGESVDQLSNPTSDFAKCISELKPDSQCVVFVVDRHGFNAFRAARDIVRRAGVQLGWEPYIYEDNKLYFGAGGRGAHVNP